MKIAIIGAGNAGCVTALKLLERRIKPEITIYHDPKEHPIEQVGQGSLPTFPALVYDVLGVDWYNNPIDATLKTGILYEGWGKKQYEIFHPFQMNVVGAHFVPSKLSNVIIIQATKSAGKASRARTVAVNIPQIVSGIRIRVMPRVLACKIVIT